MNRRFSMRQALEDEHLLGTVLTGDSWLAWRVLLIAAMGERLHRNERELFTQLTGREHEPGKRVEELWCVVGRRGGKSRAMSVLATYVAGLCDHTDYLAPGERGIVLCIAPDQKQASIVLDYCEAAFRASPILAQLIANRTTDTLDLDNRVSIEVRSSNFRRLRGPTYIAVLADEAAFWYSDEFSANADVEILNAVKPGLATTGGLLVCASSPYAKKGELWGAYRKHFGQKGDKLVLVAQGASRTFNPKLKQSVVDRAIERDPAAAKAEYLGEFRSDIQAFIDREAVEACVSRGVRERAPLSDVRYFGFTDPSGGSADSFSLAVMHREGERVILDCVREVRPRFNPESVVAEFATLLKSYRISQVRGDRYAGEWVRSSFRKHGIDYQPATKVKSDLYLGLLPTINAGTVDLLDHDKLINQLAGLERKTARGGRDSIDHGPGAHDDVCNAVAGAVDLVAAPRLMPFVKPSAPIIVHAHEETYD